MCSGNGEVKRWRWKHRRSPAATVIQSNGWKCNLTVKRSRARSVASVSNKSKRHSLISTFVFCNLLLMNPSLNTVELVERYAAISDSVWWKQSIWKKGKLPYISLFLSSQGPHMTSRNDKRGLNSCKSQPNEILKHYSKQMENLPQAALIKPSVCFCISWVRRGNNCFYVLKKRLLLLWCCSHSFIIGRSVAHASVFI